MQNNGPFLDSTSVFPQGVYPVSISKDGDKFAIVYGLNLQEGVSGFGDTLGEAFENFARDLLLHPTYISGGAIVPSSCDQFVKIIRRVMEGTINFKRAYEKSENAEYQETAICVGGVPLIVPDDANQFSIVARAGYSPTNYILCTPGVDGDEQISDIAQFHVSPGENYSVMPRIPREYDVHVG